MGTHWIALFVKPKYTVYFHSFGIEHIPKEIKHAISNKEIKANIFRIQAYTNLFSPNDFKKNDQIIKRTFKNE